MTRASKKQCNEVAEMIGATFYGINERDCTGKSYVRLNGEWHEFKTQTDAYWFMADIEMRQTEAELEAMEF